MIERNARDGRVLSNSARAFSISSRLSRRGSFSDKKFQQDVKSLHLISFAAQPRSSSEGVNATSTKQSLRKRSISEEHPAPLFRARRS